MGWKTIVAVCGNNLPQKKKSPESKKKKLIYLLNPPYISGTVLRLSVSMMSKSLSKIDIAIISTLLIKKWTER